MPFTPFFFYLDPFLPVVRFHPDAQTQHSSLLLGFIIIELAPIKNTKISGDSTIVFGHDIEANNRLCFQPVWKKY